jgi:hypothetical protein
MGDEMRVWTLSVGHLDGTHRARIDLVASPRPDGLTIVSGPANGRVLYVIERDGGFGIQVIDVNSGRVRQLAQLESDLTDAALDPEGRTAYWLVLGDSPSGGLWRADIESGHIERILGPDPGARPTGGVSLSATRIALGQVTFSEDGRRIAILDCDQACGLRVLDLPTGEVQAFAVQSIGQDLLGFAADGVAFWGQCLHLPGGDVTDRQCPALDESARRAAIQSTFQAGAELPRGWSLRMRAVAGAPPMTFALMMIAKPANGASSIRLRALGTFSGQG